MLDAATIWAPGRVNLIGEHTDYSGGLVLPAAIQIGVTLRIHAHADNIELKSTVFGRGEPFSPDGRGTPARGWARFAQAVAAELEDLGRPPVGLTATIESNLPAGAGLSSSAALEVAVGLALCVVANFELEPLALAKACQRAEVRAVGVPCGILDQAACLLGSDGAAVLLDCSSLEYRKVQVPADATFLVLDSGVQRALEETGYAKRRHELEQAMASVGAKTSATLAISALRGLDPLLQRRLRHVISENERVARFANALSEDDLVTAGRAMSDSHASLRDDYEVSTPGLDALARLAEEQGAYGARLVGGGFGGAVLSLVDSDGAAELGRRIMREYNGGGRDAIVVHPSCGARVLRPSEARS